MVEPAPLTPPTASGNPEEKFREFLEIRGEKLTEPRRVLVRQVFDSHKHFDADELVADLRGAGRQVSRATVYRTLRLLVEAGLLRELRLTNRTAYEHDYGYPSHDHLHCTGCDRVVEFNDDEVRRIREAVSLAHGFLADGHQLHHRRPLPRVQPHTQPSPAAQTSSGSLTAARGMPVDDPSRDDGLALHLRPARASKSSTRPGSTAKAGARWPPGPSGPSARSGRW